MIIETILAAAGLFLLGAVITAIYIAVILTIFAVLDCLTEEFGTIDTNREAAVMEKKYENGDYVIIAGVINEYNGKLKGNSAIKVKSSQDSTDINFNTLYSFK
jgi:hypothetical protein